MSLKNALRSEDIKCPPESNKTCPSQSRLDSLHLSKDHPPSLTRTHAGDGRALGWNRHGHTWTSSGKERGVWGHALQRGCVFVVMKVSWARMCSPCRQRTMSRVYCVQSLIAGIFLMILQVDTVIVPILHMKHWSSGSWYLAQGQQAGKCESTDLNPGSLAPPRSLHSLTWRQEWRQLPGGSCKHVFNVKKGILRC